MALTQLFPDIYRLVIPFEDIYTTVFVIKTPGGAVLFDTATYPSDAMDYIIPALNEAGVDSASLKYIVLSHSHRDHAGGLSELMNAFPAACIVSRSEKIAEVYSAFSVLIPDDSHVLLDVLRIAAIPGHSADSLGLIDLRTGVLLSGDCLQLSGIYGSGKWGANISMPTEHLSAVRMLRSLGLSAVAASHDYHPCDHLAVGADAVDQYLSECETALFRVRDLILAHPEQTDDQRLADLYNQTLGLPTIGSHVFSAMRKALESGRIV